MWIIEKIIKLIKKDSKKHVIIVEDNKILSDMYKYKLELEWFKVTVAENWIKWLKLINTVSYDLVLLDIMMPEMSWFDVLESIKKEWWKPKIIVFSNLNNTEDKNKAISLWASDYIVKSSLTPRELIEKIKILTNQ